MRPLFSSGHRKSCPSGSGFPAAPTTLPPSASASSEAGHPTPPARPPTPPSEGRGRTGESEGVSRVGSPLPPPAVRCVCVGGGGGVLASGGECNFAAASLPGVGGAGPSRSQESSVLARSAPSSVASSASAECDRRKRSREVEGSTEDRSRSHSSRSSLSCGRESRGERRCARSRSGGSCVWSRESRSHSTNRSRSRGRGCSHRDSSRSPLCSRALSAVPVAVFGPLPVSLGSLVLSA